MLNRINYSDKRESMLKIKKNIYIDSRRKTTYVLTFNRPICIEDYDDIPKLASDLIGDRAIYMIPAPGCDKTMRLEVFKKFISNDTSYIHNRKLLGQSRRHRN